jgi:hypothetical protein
VVLQKNNKNRRSTLDEGDLTPQDCLSYMQAVLDRVVAVQTEAQAAGLTISESDQRIFQEIKDVIAGQVDAMTGDDVTAELRALKKQLLQDARRVIPSASPLKKAERNAGAGGTAIPTEQKSKSIVFLLIALVFITWLLLRSKLLFP